VGCATPTVLEKAALGQVPPPEPESQKEPAAPPSPEQIACAALVSNGGAEFDAERPTTEDRFPKLIELVTEAGHCWEAQLISDGDLSKLLQLARRRLVEWYELDARVASAILLGDSTLDDTPPRRGRQSWAAAYLTLIDRLAVLEGPSVHEGIGMGEQMLRVDAQAVRVLDRLQQCDGSNPNDPLVREVEAAVAAFRDQLLAEAVAWSANPAGHHLPVEGAMTMPAVIPPKSWRPGDRISRVATLVYWIANHWGMHSIELHRSTLGAGFKAYLEAFQRAEANAPLGERLLISWPMYVHTPSIAERGTVKRVDEALQDIVYDRLNLRGYFAMRAAQNAWLMALPPGSNNPNGESLTEKQAEERLRQAAHALVYAGETTASREVRLRNVAALINQADVVFVQPVQTEGEARPGGDPRISRSVRLAELGLCLMNQSLFAGEHSPCPAEPAPTTMRLEPGQQAWCRDETPVAAEFLGTTPPEALEAYRRVFGALVVAGARLSERTQCGVAAVLRKQPLVSLHADATLLQAAMDLVEARRVPLGPQRMGEFLTAAVPRLQMDVSAPCIRLGLSSNCSLSEILSVIDRPAFPDPDGWLQLWRQRFCTSAKTGARVLEAARGSLEQGSGDYTNYISPLTIHQLNGSRADFMAASMACRDVFQDEEEQTPDMRPVEDSAKAPVSAQSSTRGDP
jgi:hypothetical protein